MKCQSLFYQFGEVQIASIAYSTLVMEPCYSRGMYFSICKELQSRLRHAKLSTVLSITKQLQNQPPTGGCVCSPEKQYLGKMDFSYVFFGNDHCLLFRCVPFSSGHCLGYLLPLSFNLSSTLNQLLRHQLEFP